MQLQFILLHRGVTLKVYHIKVFDNTTIPIQEASSQVPHNFYSVLMASGKFQHGWVVGAGGRLDGSIKSFKRRSRHALGQVMGHSGL